MPRITTIYVMIAALGALACSTAGAGAGALNVHTLTPKVNVKATTPKVQVNPQPLPPNGATAMSSAAIKQFGGNGGNGGAGLGGGLRPNNGSTVVQQGVLVPQNSGVLGRPGGAGQGGGIQPSKNYTGVVLQQGRVMPSGGQGGAGLGGGLQGDGALGQPSGPASNPGPTGIKVHSRKD
jgi:hypothetical protein